MKISHIATYKDVARLFLKHVKSLREQSSEIASRFSVEGKVEPSGSGEEFARDLERLGPTFVKLGQLLSTRPDLLPPSWLEPLTRLQDGVEEVPYPEIRAVIEEEFGVKVSHLFESFEETPVASASLGQVHRATLREGSEKVAVKVLRPGARKKVMQELAALSEVAGFLEEHTGFGRKYEPARMVAQFRNSILKELNYLEEASNLERLRENLDGFGSLVVPRAYLDFCSSRVLTMEFVKGVKLTELSGVVHTDLDGATLASDLFSSYLKQVLIDGFFHADPHPGNLLLTPDRRIALLDLGMVGRINGNQKDKLLQLLSAIADRRSAQAAAITRDLGMVRDHFDKEACDEAIIQIVESRQSRSVAEMDLGTLILEVTEACGTHGLGIPDSVFMLGKMLLNLDLIARELDPGFDPNERIRKEVSALARKRILKDLTAGNLFHYLSDLKEALSETPRRFNELVKNLSNNQFKMEVETVDEDKILAGFQKVANRITVGLILSSLIIGAAMLMEVDSGHTLFGYPALAIFFFLAAAIGACVMLVRILFHDL